MQLTINPTWEQKPKPQTGYTICYMYEQQSINRNLFLDNYYCTFPPPTLVLVFACKLFHAFIYALDSIHVLCSDNKSSIETT